ncbi:MAG TPA: hypothetical protein VFM79_04525, partial [Pelobium sp.]|nr:hypothetical protein [Pelobium sp.]
VFSLGHDAEEIGDEIKKTSKVLAKRLNRKLVEAKKSIDEKVSKVKKSKKEVDKKADRKVKEVVSKAKKETKKLAKKASSVKNVDVLPTITKASKIPTAKTTASVATKKKAPVKVANTKATSKKKEPAKEGSTTEAENAHPETPVVSKRKNASAPIPKSATKPHNTDLPLEAGPRNKYKRG